MVIGDGALWICNLTAEHFPGAIQIVDLYHARQHLWELSGKLWPTDERRRRRWTRKGEKKLDGGRIESLVRDLRSLPSSTPEAAEFVRHEADYFTGNAQACAIRPFGVSICSWAPASSNPDAKTSSAIA